MSRHTALPLVSVIVPSYNHERYLSFLFRSLENEDYPNIEVIFIDDGSSDGSFQLIEKWAKKWAGKCPVSCSTRPNRGVTQTLNDLVERASGEFVTAIHSDDFLLPGGIRQRVDYLMQHPEKQAVFGDCMAVDKDGHKLFDSAIDGVHGGRTSQFLTDGGLRHEVINRWAVPGGTLMVRRSFYKKFRYNERYVIEDFDLFLRLVSRDEIGFLPVQVSASRVHGSNTSRSEKIWVKVQEDLISAGWNNLLRFPPRDAWMLFKKIISLSWPIWKYKTKRRLKKGLGIRDSM